METIRLITQWLPQGGGLNTEALEVPIGTIIAFMGNTPPENYLACDGNTYRIADYRPVANFINLQFGSFNYFGGDGVDTFAVPDLRGEFLRGTGANSHTLSDGITLQGSGANVGVHQGATQMAYFAVSAKYNQGMVYYNYPSGNNELNLSLVDGFLTTDPIKYIISARPSEYGNVTNPKTAVAYTARPTNTSVLYCIKYR